MKNTYLILVVFLFVISSCKDNSTNNSETKEFFPLAVGNYWNYQWVMFDTTGRIENDSIYLPEKVVGDTMIDGSKWFLYNILGYIGLVKNGPNGLYGYSGNSTPLLEYKYPALANEMCGDSLYVIATNVSVSTKAGIFNCIEYQRIIYQSPIWIEDRRYIAVGIGKVKTEYYYSKDKKSYIKKGEINLVDYKLY
jgi:hypothetical protein